MSDMSFADEMTACLQSLKAFAISLCGNVTRAEDLVQETVMRALANQNSFTPGTNMSAWLFTILRNHFRSEYRKHRREVEDADGRYQEGLTQHPQQHGRIELEEFREALDILPFEQREALILVGASGFSYEEAARILRCAVGTVKSRTNRARTRLSEVLMLEPRELNKKSWDDDTEQENTGEEAPAPELPKRIWRETTAVGDSFFRPREPSPVRIYKPHNLPAALPAPLARVEPKVTLKINGKPRVKVEQNTEAAQPTKVSIPQPELVYMVVEGVKFMPFSIGLLPNGQTVQIYQAVD